MMNGRFAEVISLALLALFCNPLPTVGSIDVPGYEAQKIAEERIFSNYVPMSEDYPYPDRMRVIVHVTPSSGKINDVTLKFIRKDPGTAFSLMEAIYTSSPLPPFPIYAVDGTQINSPEFLLHFKELQNEKSVGPAKRQALGMGYPVEKFHAREKFDLHLIPLDVLNRYPGLFSRAELLSDGNIIQLPKDELIVYPDKVSPVASKKLMAFFRGWESFFVEHPKVATRAELLAFKARARAALLAESD